MDVRGNARAVGRKTYILFALLLSASAALSSGCFLADLFAFIATPFVDDRIPPECKEITSCDQEVTVAVAAICDHLEQRPDYQGLDRELTVQLAAVLKKRFETNKNKVKLVSASKVNNYLSQGPRDPDMYDLGKHVHADFVIALEIHRVDFFGGHNRRLLQGQADMTVEALDVRKRRRDASIFLKEYHCEFPKDNPPIEDNDGRGLGYFRSMFVNQMAVELSRLFAAIPSEETRFGFGEQPMANWK